MQGVKQFRVISGTELEIDGQTFIPKAPPLSIHDIFRPTSSYAKCDDETLNRLFGGSSEPNHQRLAANEILGLRRQIDFMVQQNSDLALRLTTLSEQRPAVPPILPEGMELADVKGWVNVRPEGWPRDSRSLIVVIKTLAVALLKTCGEAVD